ncbi:peptidase [Alteribacter keqinensis]|uniref:Peptidase n=1 Tax=Alteribacter keqinensis TaxID=2483800 RepID=A0A3M7TUA8_9BACI|nr:peptidase [Alteribacter keqinensis]RNA69228.1 peptidase [Alteribacter keqinensis]
MDRKQKEVISWIKKSETEAVELLQRFIREPSTQMNEAGIQNLVASKLDSIGCTVDMWEPGGEELTNHKAFISPRGNFTGSPNVVGVKKGKGKGKSLVLNGHVDVVPEGDLKDWHTDPYSGEFRDGRIYGRGATDMKGGNVAMLLAMEALHECGVQLKGDLIFQSVIEEESGGAGTLAAILRGYTADAAIIPEPTNMKIFPKQQGSMWFRLFVKGKAAHGGTRYEGVSAIEKAQCVLNELRELEAVRNKRIKDPLYSQIPIPIPINVGVIEGGDWPSSVSDLVKIEGRCGISPDETVEEVQEEFCNHLNRLAEKDPWFMDYPVDIEWFGARWLPGAIPQDHPLLSILTKQYEHICQQPPKVEASPWGTDGGLLTNIGNTPSIVFGPGVTQMAHFSNEYIELSSVLDCAAIITLTIMDWCEQPKEDQSDEKTSAG